MRVFLCYFFYERELYHSYLHRLPNKRVFHRHYLACSRLTNIVLMLVAVFRASMLVTNLYVYMTYVSGGLLHKQHFPPLYKRDKSRVLEMPFKENADGTELFLAPPWKLTSCRAMTLSHSNTVDGIRVDVAGPGL